MSLRKIAEQVGCAVNTVRSHLAAETWPHYQRNTQRVTKLSAFADYLRERQAAATKTPLRGETDLDSSGE